MQNNSKTRIFLTLHMMPIFSFVKPTEDILKLFFCNNFALFQNKSFYQKFYKFTTVIIKYYELFNYA